MRSIHHVRYDIKLQSGYTPCVKVLVLAIQMGYQWDSKMAGKREQMRATVYVRTRAIFGRCMCMYYLT